MNSVFPNCGRLAQIGNYLLVPIGEDAPETLEGCITAHREGEASMFEFAATMIVVGSAIAVTVAAGTRYLNTHVHYRDISSSQARNEPLVRPQYPSGGDWPEVA